MQSELIQLSFDKIMQTRSYTVVILGAQNKRFAIYTDPSIGRTLQMFLTDVESPRPLTHDLIDQIFEGLEVQVKQVVINDVQDTIYYARLFLEQDRGDIKHILEIDARPSDCLTLALMNNAPVYCTREVLEKTISVEE
ncbi:bifunctional nuclease family protein [Candidatus Protochlamydia phocaeensis]|uniref:bifunctional nuclease family protein n=1 Tax=Candidatus Protochlamydia phocaeensis TaxID=1414722 RepID=UPI0008381FE5|nr:bifunctional nuclease domain-containing protein [Candidatus Protochlamydia phocaeensis]